MSKAETIRRLRLGDLQRLLRHRYGHTLPDDDAGRADLYELLLAISMGPGDQRKMANAIAVWAPWMNADEARQLIDNINRTPDYLRKITAPKMGERMNLQNWQREELGIRTIAAVDMTPELLAEQRKAKKRARMWRQRRGAGSKPRDVYLANSLSQIKPWEAEGISRRTWERRRAKGCETSVSRYVASPCQIKLTTSGHRLASQNKGRVLRGTTKTVSGKKKGEGRTIRRRILANDLRRRLVS